MPKYIIDGQPFGRITTDAEWCFERSVEPDQEPWGTQHQFYISQPVTYLNEKGGKVFTWVCLMEYPFVLGCYLPPEERKEWLW